MTTSGRKRASIIIKKKNKKASKTKPEPEPKPEPKPSIASRRKATIKQRKKKHDNHLNHEDTNKSTLITGQRSIIIKKKSKILITTAATKDTAKLKKTRITRIKRKPEESQPAKKAGTGASTRSHKMNAECFKIIKKLDPKGTLTREQLIYELETLRHKLQGKLEVKEGNEVDPNISRFYNNVVIILCDVKARDIGNKVEVNKNEKDQIIASFKKKFKKMEDNKFAGAVDLTAPRSERKPEVGVQIWNRSKNVVFKDNTYREANNARARKFRKYNIQKSMDESLVNKLNNKLVNNLNKYNIVKNYPDKLGYKKYNPLTYTGVKWC